MMNLMCKKNASKGWVYLEPADSQLHFRMKNPEQLTEYEKNNMKKNRLTDL